jgi:hypothetical protein
MALPPTPFPVYLQLAITSPTAVQYQKVIRIAQSLLKPGYGLEGPEFESRS